MNMSGPRGNMPQMNGNGGGRGGRPNGSSSSGGRYPPASSSVEKPTCAQHDDLIKYIFESWSKVSQEADKSGPGGGGGGGGGGNGTTAAMYYNEQHNHCLKDFEPFDLEAYWGRRFAQNLQHS